MTLEEAMAQIAALGQQVSEHEAALTASQATLTEREQSYTASLAERDAQIAALTQERDGLVSAHTQEREGLVTTHTQERDGLVGELKKVLARSANVPEALITGSTLAEVQASAEAAMTLAAQIRSTARIPAGNPPRGGVTGDIAAMSPLDKIRAGTSA
jgi:chromosome segregation ATPase